MSATVNATKVSQSISRPRGFRSKWITALAPIRLMLLSIAAVLFMAPIYVMIAASLKSAQQAGVAHIWAFPTSVHLSGLIQAWARLEPNVINSVLIVVPAVLISSLIGSLNGYLLSKVRFPFANVLFVLVLFGMYIPFQAVLVPLVKFMQWSGLYGSLFGVIVAHCVYGLTITTLIFRNYYAVIPDELLEAAAIDGTGLLGTFVKVLLPLSIPGFVVAGIFQFTSIWNDFLFGLVITPNGAAQPVTVALNNLSGTTSVDWNVVMSGALISAIPTIVLYLFIGRFFIKGLLAGSYR